MAKKGVCTMKIDLNDLNAALRPFSMKFVVEEDMEWRGGKS